MRGLLEELDVAVTVGLAFHAIALKQRDVGRCECARKRRNPRKHVVWCNFR